jgi:hypothetical protein
MRNDPDEFSSHPYEVKNVYMKGSSFKAVVFYLVAGRPVEIKIEDVLKKTNLWMEPTQSEPKREYHVFFEIRPKDGMGIAELYISSFTAELKVEEK